MTERSSPLPGGARAPVASVPPRISAGPSSVPVTRDDSYTRSLLLFALVLWGIGWLPLLGGPRYEAALVAGLLGPAWTGIVTGLSLQGRLSQMRKLSRQDGLRRAMSGSHLFGQALMSGGLHALVPVIVAAIHGWLRGFCEPTLGFTLLLLGPGIGCVLGGLLGLGVALGSHRICRRAPSPWWISTVPLCIFVSAAGCVWQFYASPGVRLLDSFAGYFAGPVYDPVEYRLGELWNFRSVALLIVSGTGVLCSVGSASVQKRVVWRWREQSPRTTWVGRCLGSLLLISALLLLMFADRFGWSSSEQALRLHLSRVVQEGPCAVYFPAEVSEASARTVAWECQGHLAQHASYFATELPSEVTVYLFASTVQKKELMGAGVTNVAKPWRYEVYVSDQGFPHPILGHELAHVVTAAFGRGPFRVAGMLGGWVMDPGRVEGFAEAAALRESSPGTLREWAAAMKLAHRLPPLEQLFQLSFFGTSAARSYTASGAFVDFVRRSHGPETLKAWYGGGDLTKLTAQSWATMERRWHAELDSTKVPGVVAEMATPRFSRPGVFEQRCPHALDRRLSEFAVACQAEPHKAARLAAEIRQLDPARVDMSLELPRCVAAAGDHERAIEELARELQDPARYEPEEQRKARLALGDQLFFRGRTQEAKEHYERALEMTFAPHERRQLDFRLWSLQQQGKLGDMLRRYLVAPSASPWGIQGILTAWLDEGDSLGHRDVARYLALRQAIGVREWSLARYWLNRLRARRLPLWSLQKEAARLRLLVACHDAQPHSRQTGNGQQRDPSDDWVRAEVAAALAGWLEYRSGAADEEHSSRWAERCVEGLR